MPALAAVLPDGAVLHVVHLADWPWNDGSLESWTRTLLPQALERRQREFAGGRVCAARAIGALNGATVQPQSVGRRPEGGPDWPDGIVGAVAHTRQIAGAVAMRRADAAGIGLDIEPIMSEARAATVARVVAHESELAHVKDSAALGSAEAVTIAFAAKEALFKCLHPLVRRMFFLGDARVDRVAMPADAGGADRPMTGSFTICLLKDLSGQFRAGRLFEGLLAREDGVMYAVVCVRSGELVDEVVEERQQIRA